VLIVTESISIFSVTVMLMEAVEMVERLQGKKVVGLKQTIKALKTGNCKKLYIAKDSDDNIRENIEGLAMESSIEVIYIDTMKELGRLCGIQVGAVAAATV